MNNYFNNFKSGVIIGLGIVFTIGISGTIYATLSNMWTSPQDLEVSSNDILTSNSWNQMLSNFNSLKNEVAGLGEAPKNSVMAFASTSCPNGWKAADGTNGTPDLRGVFIRGANDFGTGNSNRDQDRATYGSGILTYQEDGIRNITGGFDFGWNVTNGFHGLSSYGAFYNSATKAGRLQGTDTRNGNAPVPIFDASKSTGVTIGSDNRPKNVALIYCVKE